MVSSKHLITGSIISVTPLPIMVSFNLKLKSQVDKCIWFKYGIVLLQHVNNLLIVGVDDNIIKQFKKDFAAGHGGNLEACLGVEVTKHSNKTIELCQPFLIDKIIKTIAGDENNIHSFNIPAAKESLRMDEEGEERKYSFNYRQAIRMMTYLQGTLRPDIAMPVHQCARFSANPKCSHEKAVIKIVCCLKETKEKGIILCPNTSYGIKCFVDASFESGWHPDNAHNAMNILSRTGYILYYASCSVHWCSKMQK